MADWRRQYWDSPLFIAYLTDHDKAKTATVASLLQSHYTGAISIVISSFLIAEIRSVALPGAPTPSDESETEVHRIGSEQARQVQQMLHSDALDMYVLTPRIAQLAADIGNQYPRLLPGDCVHIATAIESDSDVLFTWDGSGQRRRPGRMLRYDGQIEGLAIKEPFVPMGPIFDPPSPA